MGQFIVLMGDATCPSCGGSHHVEVQCPVRFTPDDDSPRQFAVGDPLGPLDVPWVTGVLADAHPEAGNLDRGRALLLWWCPQCSDHRWVFASLDTQQGKPFFTGLEITVPSDRALESADWLDYEIRRMLPPDLDLR